MRRSPARRSPRASALPAAVLLTLLAFPGRPGAPLLADEPGALAGRITEIMARSAFKTSTFGILIAHVDSGRVLYEHNAEKLLAPASNTKIVSCAGALAALGHDFRFETTVVGTGPIEHGTLRGDLVLVASGDPNLSQRVRGDSQLLFEDNDHSYAAFSKGKVVPGDPLKVLRDLARQVRDAGVEIIDGNVTVDDGLFEETYDPFVGNFSAVCVNDNLVDVLVSPGDAPGEPARIRVLPEARVVEVRSRATTGSEGTPTRLSLEARDGVASYDLRGSIAVRERPILRVAKVADPAMAAAHYLSEAVEEAGIAVRGEKKRARFGPAVYRQYRVLARHRSPPLSQAIRVVLKVSQNLHATMLPVLVGALKGERATRYGGYRVIHDLFAERGVDMDSIVIASGSGGGRADRLSPRWTVDFLRHMKTRKDFAVFLDALPIGGKDGTLASHFQSEDLRGRVRAKTGTLRYRGALNDRWIYTSKALSGYLDLRAPEQPDNLWAFSIIIANTSAANRQRGVRDLFRAQEDILRAARQAIEGEERAEG